jgi:hypothetical protein
MGSFTQNPASPQVAPQLLPGSDRCRCMCGLHFTTSSTFEKHRIGSYGTIAQPGDRRCLTAAELAAKGWSQNARHCWQRPGPAISRARAVAGAAIAPNRHLSSALRPATARAA